MVARNLLSSTDVEVAECIPLNPITHILMGWCLADTVRNLNRREKALITSAAVASDLDGVGLIAELATRDGVRPLLWWTEYHHTLGHNLLFGIVVSATALLLARSRRVTTALFAFLAVHLHIIADIVGSRGPDEYQWPVPYLYPFASTLQLSWSGQWYLNAWPNIAITVALLVATILFAWRRGYSILGILSPSADRALVHALRGRFGQPRCAGTGDGA